MTLFGVEPVFFIPVTATMGSDTSITVDGAVITVTPFTTTFSYGDLDFSTTTYYRTSGGLNYIARFEASFDVASVSYIENTDFFDVDDAEPNPDKFIPKCKCKDNRDPPADQPGSDCTGGGAEEGCICVTLTFCSMIDYPIDGLLPYNDADDGAEATYTGLVDTLSLSDDCKDALKNFICASVFLRCDQDRVFYSPCRQMCVECSCTDGPVGAFSCTYYTDKDTCVSIGEDQDTSCLKDKASSSSASSLVISFASFLAMIFLAFQM